MAWLVLGVAVVTEIIWALSLKWAGVQATWQAASVPIALSFVNMGLLALAMRGLPAGTAYAVWTGIGAAGAFACGLLLYGDPATFGRFAGVGLIISGVVVLKLAH